MRVGFNKGVQSEKYLITLIMLIGSQALALGPQTNSENIVINATTAK